MKLLKTICILCIAFSTIQVEAQDSSNIEHVINSEVFNKERKVRVFLPQRYKNDTISNFAVVYILDAQSDLFWNMAKGNIGYTVDNYASMPMIAVGIVSDNRGSEFNPENTELQEHLKKEVFPLIEKNYRTDGFRTIVGHSWGGAFVSNTLFSENKDMFDAYIGISPSFGDTDNIIEKNAAKMLKNNTVFRKYLYLSHGDVGRRELEFGGYVNSIDKLIKQYPNESLAWEPRLIERVDHWQIVGPSLCDGLVSMSRNYFADQKIMEDLSKSSSGDLKAQVEAFNKKRKMLFGYVHEPSASYLNFVANDFRDVEDYKTALVGYHMALDKKPNDVKVFVNICDVYDKIGDKTKAKSSFQKALKLMDEQKDELSESYYRDVSEWIKKKLESYN
ncbi:alpha/beta hydrolase-fold protein [uncultured Psychroserpens sp.]|uniref:alpha/beta hydrolase-fold protein n=1 Tax=uncultured Psychroserpens sp. TaxID=255436 RepID=UPI002626EAA6|nr:alpha/beta hydrolase-fold protein [uncultured Psychroserpens sp.]